MNREAIETLVAEATGRSDKTTLVRSAINIALSKVSAFRLWSDLIVEDEVSIVANDASVELASDVARVSEVRVMDGLQSKPLLVRPKAWLLKRVPDPSARSTGRPCYGYLQGTTLFFVPLSNDSYEIRYTYCRLHPALATSTDAVLIRGADAAVVAYTIYWVFKSIEKHEDASMWLDTYNRELSDAAKIDRGNTVTQHKADQHRAGHYPGDGVTSWSEYWLDPWCQRMP